MARAALRKRFLSQSAHTCEGRRKLVPLSTLASCGELGKFDLAKVAGAQELCSDITADARLYYRLWRECESLSLAPPGEPELPGEDESVDAE